MSDSAPQDLSLDHRSHSSLEVKIQNRSARVGIVGIGYVGLPTMVAVAEQGFNVIGIDISLQRVNQINDGISYIEQVSNETLGSLLANGKITATTDYKDVHNLDVIVVCVPTPVTLNKEPDLQALRNTMVQISSNIRRGQLVILQSTTFPGTTQEVAMPELEKSGLKAGTDFHLAFALERIDPGNEIMLIQNVPKVVGGITNACTQVASDFLSTFVIKIVPVSSPRVAEMTKLLENVFRSVNIALVNELSILCNRMDIDIWEVIQAASTKPAGFMPFYPGPGVGGHCIPVDPAYLSWKAKEFDFHVRFIELASDINDNMPRYTVSRITEILGRHGKPLAGSQVLAIGASFKENIGDTRHSPAIKVMELLQEQGAIVTYSDPNVPKIVLDGNELESIQLIPEVLQDFDAVVILVDHDGNDWDQIINSSQLILDTRNAANHLAGHENLFRI